MIKWKSIEFKIGVLYVLMLGLILVVFSGILFFSARYILYRNLDEELSSKGKEIAAMIQTYIEALGPSPDAVKTAAVTVIRFEHLREEGHGYDALGERLLRLVDEYDIRKDWVSLEDWEGRPFVQSYPPDAGFKELLDRNPRPQAALTAPHYSRLESLRLIRMPVTLNGRAFTLEIATSTEGINELLGEWLFFAGIAIPLAMFFAGFSGRILVVQMLRPVSEIARTAEKISHDDLALRVQASDADEEIQHLVNAFNDMISRLETSFNHIQEFSAHVAHELKTPLTVIRGEAEVALRKDREPRDYVRVLEINLREAKRMVKVIDDMLLLSRLEYETEGYEFEFLELRGFLKEIDEQAMILAESKKITVSFEGEDEMAPLRVRGDQIHLRRLFFNLIDNAIKFTPRQGRIQMKVQNISGQVRVTVQDNGSGIAPQDMPRIFEKFFHRDRAASGIPGNGLGLSIALFIAKAHQKAASPWKASPAWARLSPFPSRFSPPDIRKV